MRIVFMGTPDYSVRTLEKLISSRHEVVGVFAQPDKPVGRKHILTAPPVKVCAQGNGIPVFQPRTLRSEEAPGIIKGLVPDIIVVVAYGKILPNEILTLPRFGCINGHASLLPRHRGASPIQWAICCGDTETGVTVMQMDEGMDTGDIIGVARTPIGQDETADGLFERLSHITADLILKTLDDIENGMAVAEKQPEEGVSYAPVIKKEMAHLDFREDAATLVNKVRGFYSWPCAYTVLCGKKIKVLKAQAVKTDTVECGTVVGNTDGLVISCANGTALKLITVIPEGSKEMSSRTMLNGFRIPLGERAM